MNLHGTTNNVIGQFFMYQVCHAQFVFLAKFAVIIFSAFSVVKKNIYLISILTGMIIWI
jgi:hypothetical protein